LQERAGFARLRIAFPVPKDGFLGRERHGLAGLWVKVTPKGKKVFIVIYRTGGAGSRPRNYTIGPYGRITLAMARAQLRRFSRRVSTVGIRLLKKLTRSAAWSLIG
jgi:hypothetical protein